MIFIYFLLSLVYKVVATNVLLQSARGFGAVLIIVDEAAFVNEEAFYSVIVPVTNVENTVLVCISSPFDSDNWFSRIMTYEDEEKPGTKLVNSIHFTNACAACLKKDPSKWKYCDHTNGIEPSFKSKESKEKWAKIMKLDGKLGRHMTEDYAIVLNSFIPCFKERYVKRFVDRKNRIDPLDYITKNDDRVGAAFFCCDPNAGGKDESAVVVGYTDLVSGITQVSSLCERLLFLGVS